ncbi:DMT family transporter [Streptomyces iconiensis]|uniref:DMT family transporter n=1 Tax=Streptomyces iconiensis TaxID=1384038 RepID=A0ABT6ZNI2_9ACTN|nr:DMT family transporter [Streptomyces iconiensis]MDJ1130598.1 DMT family transporter [Streptomyces iconiensis]
MLWGVAAALLANLLFSAGFVIEKRALSSLPPLSTGHPARLVLHLLRSPLWILGAASLLLAFTAQLAVYRTLPLVAAQGLFVTGLVILLLLSTFFLGERASGKERQGMVAILVSLLMIVFSLHNSSETVSRVAPVPVLLLICLPSLAFGVGLFLSAERRSRRRHRLPTAGVPYGVAVGFLYGVSSLAIKGVAGLLDFGNPGGTVAAVFSSPYPYILLFTGSSGLVLSQTALQRCRASLIVPVCTTVNFLFATVSGTIAFDEPLPDEPLRLALRLGGAALAISVLVSLPRHEPGTTPAEQAPQPGDHQEGDGEQEQPRDQAQELPGEQEGELETEQEAVPPTAEDGAASPPAGERTDERPPKRPPHEPPPLPPAGRPLSATLPPVRFEKAPERQ